MTLLWGSPSSNPLAMHQHASSHKKPGCTPASTRAHRAAKRLSMSCRAEAAQKEKRSALNKHKGLMGLGDLLGPIGLTLGGALRRKVGHSACLCCTASRSCIICGYSSHSPPPAGACKQWYNWQARSRGCRALWLTRRDPKPCKLACRAGPHSPLLRRERSLTRWVLAEHALCTRPSCSAPAAPTATCRTCCMMLAGGEQEEPCASGADSSIHDMSTQEWRSRYEADGCVDLWVQEEFNAGSRLVVRPLPPSRPFACRHCCLPGHERGMHMGCPGRARGAQGRAGRARQRRGAQRQRGAAAPREDLQPPRRPGGGRGCARGQARLCCSNGRCSLL
jgi:hypothetical protein